MAEFQGTLAASIHISGTGLHTGKQGTMTFHPASPGFGIQFRRTDLEGKPMIPAHITHVVDTARGTTIGIDSVRIYTIEHVLAALIGMGVDNALIDLNMDEIPIRDGSSRYFVEAIEQVGIQTQSQTREYIEIKEELVLHLSDTGSKLRISPADEFSVEVEIDYATKVLGKQQAYLSSLSEFNTEIAPCRTFVFLHELEFLLHNNLIKGGDLSNAIVFVNRKVSQEELDRLATLFNKPKVKVKDEGILNNLELYFPNEAARHKLLDVVGDLSLLGKRLKGKVQAYKPGHYANTEFAKLIYKTLNSISYD